MNRPKADRLRLCMAIAAVSAFAAILPATASADFNAGTSALVEFTTPAAVDVPTPVANPVPGGRNGVTITQNYTYTGVPSGVPANSGDDLKQWTLDLPSGYYGNPNAIAFGDRCTVAQYTSYGTSAPIPATPCPASAQVGTASLSLGVDASGATASQLPGKIYLVQSANPLQEVPAKLFTVFTTHHSMLCPGPDPAPRCIVAALSETQVAPVAGGDSPDYGLRAVSKLVGRPDLSAALSQPPNTTEGHVKQIVFRLWGELPDSTPFATNPTTCGPWKSTVSSKTYGTSGPSPFGNSESTASQTEQIVGTVDPGGSPTGSEISGTYAEFDAGTVTPDCSGPAPVLSQTASASIDNNARSANPGLTVSVSNPGADVADKASKMVTTLPSAVTINVKALSNVCEQAQVVQGPEFCPALSQVGTAEITSPMLVEKQYGKVFMTRGTDPGLPFMSIWVNGPNDTPAGAFRFRLDATTKFAQSIHGPGFDRVETTFDNLPQLPFDSFVVKINGGNADTSMLINRECPIDGTAPLDGPIDFVTSGYAGGSKASQSATNLDPCYGASTPGKVSKCVKIGKKLSVKPKGLVATPNIANVQLLTGTKKSNVKKRATDSKAPFSFKLTMKKSKFKKNRTYRYSYRIQYKDGKVLKTKTNKFRTCK